jgi:hypothetical protein
LGAPTAPDPFFGTLFDDHGKLTREQRRIDMDNQAAAGLGVIRVHVHWAQIETKFTKYEQSPVLDWNALDQTVEDAAARGLRILPVVYDTPGFYKPPNSPPVEVPPAEPSKYGRFLGRLVQRYGPNGTFWCSGVPSVCKTPYLPITTWQIWNEPNFPSFWKNAPNPSEYLDLLKAAYGNIKLSDPNAEVVMAGLADVTGTGDVRDYRTYLNALYAAGAKPFFDTLAIHAYAEQVEDAAAVPKAVRQIADANLDTDKKIWITEFGWATGGARSAFITSTDCQAARVHKMAVEWRRLRDDLKLRGAVQFQWRDRADTSLSWPNYAGLTPAVFGGPPKPALGELANAIAFRTPDPRYTVDRACNPGSPEDVALGAPITASSTGPAASTEAGSEPKRAVDGLSNTRWSSAPGAGEWIKADLGSVRNVSKVRLNWGTDYPSHYIVETSTDDTSFTPADDVTINQAGPHGSSFSPRNARYVRVTGVTPAVPGGGISLWDFNVFEPAPPQVNVTTDPSVPPDQGGYFNAADVKAGAGQITVRVAARDASGVTDISCTDNGFPVALPAQSGSDPRSASFGVALDGTHQIRCQATNGATPPETGATPGSHTEETVRIDTTAPGAAIAPLSDFQMARALNVAWSGRDTGSGIGSFDVRRRRASRGSSRFGAFTRFRDHAHITTASFAGSPGNAVCFSSRARDIAGNVSAYSAERCTATPLDDRALRRRGSWTRVSRTGYFNGTLLQSSTPGSTLTSPTITGSRLALLASTGRHGGTMTARWRGHTKTIRLRATRTRRRLIRLRGFTGRGRLVVRVTGHGRTVIDGLGVWKHP